MVAILARAIDFTHKYLQSMGARTAPNKSYNFASTPVATKWLKETWWNEISDSIEVVKDFRYLGAHLSTRGSSRSLTLMWRWDTALQQLRKRKFTLATAEMKARAIITKILAGALYGIEAGEATCYRMNQLTAERPHATA